MARKRIVIAGGSGFIGRALAGEFSARGHDVTVLTRTVHKRNDRIREISWDGRQPGAWAECLDGADAILNLAGSNVNCPHTEENLHEITASRVNSVNAVAAAIAQVKMPPQVWVQAGAVGFYGDTKDAPCDETSSRGNDSLAEVCRQWEDTFNSAMVPQTRRVLLRIGFVLGRDGGALPVLARLTRWFLGGTVGSGRQYIDWIHIADLVRMFTRVWEDDSLAGTFNAVGPAPVTNAVFMRELRKALHRPWSPPAPEFAVKWGARLMRSEPSLALASQRCVPKRFLEAGFQFQFSELASALKDLY